MLHLARNKAKSALAQDVQNNKYITSADKSLMLVGVSLFDQWNGGLSV